tara:strand:- start:122 stop:370 length:249 start_codon:yes stop_codon:yes gene_type:complete
MDKGLIGVFFLTGVSLGIMVASTLIPNYEFSERRNQSVYKSEVVRDIKSNCKIVVVYGDNTISSSLDENGIPESYDHAWKFQ